MSELGHSGAGDYSVLVEIDGLLVGNQSWTAREEIRASYLMQTPDRHPTDLRVGVDQGGDHGVSDVLKGITGKRAEPPDGSEDSSPETFEVFLFEVDEERCDDRYIVSVQGWQAPQDFRHGLRSAPADPAGLVVDEPHEAAQEFANVVGIIFCDAGGGRSQCLDCAIADPDIRSISQCDVASEDAPPPRCHFGDLVEAPLVEELV